MDKKRIDAIDACRMLNQLWWDILGADGILQAFEERGVQFRSADQLQALQRVVFFSLVLSLTKFGECYDRYQRNFPADVRDRLKEIRLEVIARQIWVLRKQVVAHLLVKETQRPPTSAQIEEMARLAMRGDSIAFFQWIRRADAPSDPDTVFGALNWAVRRLRHDFKLQDDELELASGPNDEGPLAAEL